MPSVAQVDGSGTAATANSKSLDPVVNTTLPYSLGARKDQERQEIAGLLGVIDAESRVEVRG
jgi:hypothetical protein